MPEENENLNLDASDENSKIWNEEPDSITPKDTKEKIVLTEEQKEKLKKSWFESPVPPPIYELVKKVFGKDYDARSSYGRAIKKALSEMDLDSSEKVPLKPKIELTESQKEYITNNCKNHKVMEMVREHYGNQKLMPNSAEARAFIEYYNSLPENLKAQSYSNEKGEDTSEYKPPKTLLQAKERVNSYVQNGISEEQFKTNTKTQECLKALIRFCHVHRYILIMEDLTDEKERTLFESEFIRCVWDKPDVTEEEIGMYLNLCWDVVDQGRLRKELSFYTDLLQKQSDDSEGKKMSMTLVESIGKIREDIDANQKRQTKLSENLQGKRSDRINTLVKSNASVLQLVEMWREEKTRKRALQLAKRKKEEIKDEITRIDNMDEFTAQIFGLNKESFEV